jgi:uncharacterized coiled-coil protein SlyX
MARQASQIPPGLAIRRPGAADRAGLNPRRPGSPTAVYGIGTEDSRLRPDGQETMAEPGDLAMANEHVADAERRIARQRDLIAELQRDGHDTKKARELLATMLDLLTQMRRHREHLVQLSKRPKPGHS